MKIHTLKRTETLRSKAPLRLPQERWGLGITYYLVRLEMLDVVTRLRLPPARLSFRPSLLLIRNFLVSTWLAVPASFPKAWRRSRFSSSQNVGLLATRERSKSK